MELLLRAAKIIEEEEEEWSRDDLIRHAKRLYGRRYVVRARLKRSFFPDSRVLLRCSDCAYSFYTVVKVFINGRTACYHCARNGWLHE